MGDNYCLYGQEGLVDEVQLPGKAVLSFSLNGATERALLWVKSFVHQGKNMEQGDSFSGILNVGDVIFFDCHRYLRESRDRCSWYVTKAWEEAVVDIPLGIRVMNQTGFVFELDPGKGVIVFERCNQEHRVLFLRSKFYHFGKRPGNKHSLWEFLSDNDPVQFDAEICQPTVDNKQCQWFASLVWKGKKPTGINGFSSANAFDDLTADDSVSNTDREIDDENDFPSLSLPPGISERHGYKVDHLKIPVKTSIHQLSVDAFEASSTLREGKGNVIALINEECGIALWMVRQNTWETVFFHRKNAYLSDTCLAKFDLQESLIEGTTIEIVAVPAVTEFPCRWLAKEVVALC